MTESFDKIRAAFADSHAIEREIGQGGMATVYLAHDRKVALKVLRPELAAAMGGDRFPREIQIVAQLTHPHIVPLYDSGQVGGYLFYVMPFVDGESLRQTLRREGALAVHQSARILSEVWCRPTAGHRAGSRSARETSTRSTWGGRPTAGT